MTPQELIAEHIKQRERAEEALAQCNAVATDVTDAAGEALETHCRAQELLKDGQGHYQQARENLGNCELAASFCESHAQQSTDISKQLGDHCSSAASSLGSQRQECLQKHARVHQLIERAQAELQSVSGRNDNGRRASLEARLRQLREAEMTLRTAQDLLRDASRLCDLLAEAHRAANDAASGARSLVGLVQSGLGDLKTLIEETASEQKQIERIAEEIERGSSQATKLSYDAEQTRGLVGAKTAEALDYADKCVATLNQFDA